MREMAASDVLLELNPGPENPRNSEGAIAELADGRRIQCDERKPAQTGRRRIGPPLLG